MPVDLSPLEHIDNNVLVGDNSIYIFLYYAFITLKVQELVSQKYVGKNERRYLSNFGKLRLLFLQNNVSDALFSKFMFNPSSGADFSNLSCEVVVKFKSYLDERNGFQSHEFPLYENFYVFFFRWKMKFIIFFKLHELFDGNFLKMSNKTIANFNDNYC